MNTLALNVRCRFARAAALSAFGLTLLMLAGCGGSSSSTINPPTNLQGTWGGGTSEAPAVLTLTSTGGTLAFACGAEDVLTQPLVANADGTFNVIATEHIPLLGAINGMYPQVHLVGTVSGSTITLHGVFTSGPGPSYTVTYGKSAPTFNGACPA